MTLWIVKLKNGLEIKLRLMTADDKYQLLDMFSSMSENATQWGMPPYTEDRITRWIENIDHLIPLVALYKQRMVGYASVYKHQHPRLMGTAEMGIYLHQDFHSLGLGTLMTEKVLSLAKEQGLHRLGLQVVEDNIAAVILYKKIGFKIEGTMLDAYLGQDGKFHNMLVMGKIITDS